MADATGPVQFFLLGQQAALNERMQKIKQLEYDRKQQLPTARASYFQGSPSQLQQIAPSEWSTLETQRAQRVSANQKTQIDAVEQARQEQLLRAKGLLGALNTVRQDPQRWPSVVGMIEQNGLVAPGTFDAGSPPSVEDLESAINEQRGIVDTLQDPQVGEETRNILIAHNYSPNDASGLRDPRVQQAVNSMLQAKNKGRVKPGVVVNNASPLTTGNVSKYQNDVVEAQDTLRSLQRIKNAATDPNTGITDFGKYLGFKNVTKGKWINFRDRLGTWIPAIGPSAEDRKYAENYNRFRAGVMKMRAEEFHRLIGGAQTPVEIENLVDAFLNMDMAPSQFSSVYEELMQTTQELLSARQDILRSGVQLGSDDYNAAMDRVGPQIIRAHLASMRSKAKGQSTVKLQPLFVGD